MGLLLKRSSENLPNNINEVVLQLVYGNRRKAPGDDGSPYQQLLLKKENEELKGLWVPPNSLSKGMGLKWVFPSVSAPFRFPDEKPVPLHIAVGYDAFKYKDVVELSKQFPGQVMKMGFFTNDILVEAKLISKTVEEFENRTEPTT